MSHSPLTKLGWYSKAVMYAFDESICTFGQKVREFYWMQALATEKRISNLRYQYPKQWKAYNRQRMTAVARRVKPLPEECMDFSYYLFLLKIK